MHQGDSIVLSGRKNGDQSQIHYFMVSCVISKGFVCTRDTPILYICKVLMMPPFCSIIFCGWLVGVMHRLSWKPSST